MAKRGDNNWREIYWRLSQIGDWVWVVGQSRNGYSQLALAREKAAEKRWFRIQIDTTWQGDFWRERFRVIRIAEPTRRRKAVGRERKHHGIDFFGTDDPKIGRANRSGKTQRT